MLGLVIIGLIFLTSIITYILYHRFGLCKKFYHDLLGWHEPAAQAKISFDGCSLHTVCKHCGKEIMQDFQGNWF